MHGAKKMVAELISCEGEFEESATEDEEDDLNSLLADTRVHAHRTKDVHAHTHGQYGVHAHSAHAHSLHAHGVHAHSKDTNMTEQKTDAPAEPSDLRSQSLDHRANYALDEIAKLKSANTTVDPLHTHNCVHPLYTHTRVSMHYTHTHKCVHGPTHKRANAENW